MRRPAPRQGHAKEFLQMLDALFYGIAFVFLGACLLYVRAADKL
jgi:NhaP-type Na+/H+ or K+/H+ antiporter